MLRYYKSLGAGTHIISFDLKRLPNIIEELVIECDEEITIQDNMNFLGANGSDTPLIMSGVLKEKVGLEVGVSPIEFKVVLTTTTKLYIKLETSIPE